ncbi:hypothetical protein G7076_04005 [Sphingomonas sp. HDW15A]|uniref:peptidyl-prolyl cis-trans isomerase n=1 Tax=Sphingomonas sp. HDW15A TaxID=2714942 RepID=UPI00140C8B31|nr:peptidyl-prolyl cis-trans isomerase [Sphingomonas sp. HDW15A]QIK95741.1 hypothetical protein G7076_04005 [Sphingomonas sp. HDW15A]
MIASFRRLSKSMVGSIIMVLFFVAILAGFALQDITGTVGGFGGSLSKNTLAKAGSEELTEREFSAELQRRLAEVRQQNPSADYSALANEFQPMLDSLLQQKALAAFASGQDITLSKRLVDAEIARLPQTKGLDGRFSEEAYARFLNQIRMTDTELRQQISRLLINRIMLAPAAAEPRVPVGIARPYAAMQLEVREADVALFPTETFLATIGDPSDAQVQQFYRSNLARYTIPEQRVIDIARIGPEQVAKVAATDKEIADYYRANQATYGSKSQRVISQVVLPSQQAANALAAKLRSGQAFADAAKPLGYSASDISVGPQTREEFAKLTSAQVAAAAFAANAGSGAIVGPVRSTLGWHVIKIDGLQNIGGRSLEAVRGEIAEKLTSDKRENALADLIAGIEDGIADGKNFSEALAGTGIQPLRTPAITASGSAPRQPDYKFPAELAPALRAGFDLGQGDDPVVETLGEKAGYVLVGVDQVMPAAPAPIAEVRDRVARDWKIKQAIEQARSAAAKAASALSKGASMADAVKATGSKVSIPAPRHETVRRIQLAQMGAEVPPALKMMFSLAEGRSRMVADPGGRGFVLVKVTKVVPGDVTLQPNLVSQIQREFQQPLATEYAEQYTKAIEADVGVKRNQEAIDEAKRRIIGGGS